MEHPPTVVNPQILTCMIEDVIQAGAEPFPVMYLCIRIPDFGGFGNRVSKQS